MQRAMRVLIGVTVCVTLFACGGDANPPASSDEVAAFVGTPTPGRAPSASSIDVQPGTPPVIATNVDPCTFFSKAELESAFGVPFAPPKKGRGEPSCRFYNSNTGSVTVRAGETVSTADFDALREQIGAEAERVSGIGESAYFWGPKLYVLNNGRQLIIFVSTDQLTPQLRSTLTSLGRLGAPRLRA